MCQELEEAIGMSLQMGKNKKQGPCILQKKVHVILVFNVKESFHYAKYMFRLFQYVTLKNI